MPVFFGATLKDYVALAASAIPLVKKNSPHEKTRIREFDSGHWVQYEKKDEVNKELLEWLESL
jgi:soluble epoxide hydrolase / lipid-phosphate phosphatase